MHITRQRIVELCRIGGVKKSAVCDSMGVSRNYLIDKKQQGSAIPDARLAPAAAMLGTTVEYLRGKTDDPGIAKKSLSANNRANALVNFDRLEKLIREKGVTKKFLCDKAGKSRGYIAGAKVGNGSISDEALKIFARELGTTVEYLRGETDERRKVDSPTDDAESDLIVLIRGILNMTSEERKKLLTMTRVMFEDAFGR